MLERRIHRYGTLGYRWNGWNSSTSVMTLLSYVNLDQVLLIGPILDQNPNLWYTYLLRLYLDEAETYVCL